MSVQTSKEKILLEAIKLFAEHGYFAVSMSEIAKNAKMTKSNLYHHFDSKEDLYKQLIKQAYDQLINLLTSHKKQINKNNFKEIFKKFLKEYIDFGVKNRDLIYVLLQNISRLDINVRSFIHNSRKKIISIFEFYLQEGISRGEIKKSLNPKMSAEILHSLVHITILQKLRKNFSESAISDYMEEIYKWLEF